MKKQIFLAVFSFCVLINNYVLGQNKKGEELTYISPKAYLYLTVSGSSYADSVKSYMQTLFIDKKYNLVSEAKYRDITKEYLSSMLKPVDANTVVNESTLAQLTSGNLILNKLEVNFEIDESDTSSLKAEYLSWQIFPTPPNTGRYKFEKKIVDQALLNQHSIFEVLNMLVNVITTEQEKSTEKKKKKNGKE